MKMIIHELTTYLHIVFAYRYNYDRTQEHFVHSLSNKINIGKATTDSWNYLLMWIPVTLIFLIILCPVWEITTQTDIFPHLNNQHHKNNWTINQSCSSSGFDHILAYLLEMHECLKCWPKAVYRPSHTTKKNRCCNAIEYSINAYKNIHLYSRISTKIYSRYRYIFFMMSGKFLSWMLPCCNTIKCENGTWILLAPHIIYVLFY